ncbi:MAG: hypothetical protein RLO21_15460 [Nitratireductor sp.]
MSDGPFTNFTLGSRWKRFAEAAENEATHITQRCALASDAILREILTEDNQALLIDLVAYAQRRQLDIDPRSRVVSIFESHSMTPFADILMKHVLVLLSDQSSMEFTIAQAIEEAVSDQIKIAKSRIEEECIRAREHGSMHADQFERTTAQIKATFDVLDKDHICRSVQGCNKNAFKEATVKQADENDGPYL